MRSGSREANGVRKEEPSPGAKVRFVEYFHPLSEFASSATTKIVAVFNVAGLFPFDRRLATQYQLREHFSAERATSLFEVSNLDLDWSWLTEGSAKCYSKYLGSAAHALLQCAEGDGEAETPGLLASRTRRLRQGREGTRTRGCGPFALRKLLC